MGLVNRFGLRGLLIFVDKPAEDWSSSGLRCGGRGRGRWRKTRWLLAEGPVRAGRSVRARSWRGQRGSVAGVTKNAALRSRSTNDDVPPRGGLVNEYAEAA
jgi:hypothetical protein